LIGSMRNELIDKLELEHDYNFIRTELDRLQAALEDRTSDYTKARQQ